MEWVPRQKYTKEFREQAVQLVLEQDDLSLIGERTHD